MALTTLDPKTALIVIDLQKGVVALPVAHAIDDVIARSCELLAAFRQHKLPVVLVNVAGAAPGRAEQKRSLAGLPADWAELIPAVNRQASDHTITKRGWGAFSSTDLDAYLKSQGVTQVVICGVATSIGVESTARQAHELGYHVTLAVDAMTDMIAEAHTHAITRIFPRVGETGTAQDIVALLASTR